MKVLKFGGSSVANAECIQQVMAIVKNYLEKNETFVVVVSAMGGLTDLLLSMSSFASAGDEEYKALIKTFLDRHRDAAHHLIPEEKLPKVLRHFQNIEEELENLLHGVFLIKELTPKTRDYILSFGERCSAYLISKALWYKGINARDLDTRKLIRTNSHFGNAKVDTRISYHQIQEFFSSTEELQIATGFIASTSKEETTTLGRGGSDYTASLLGSALDAEVIEIWTDVAGVMTADPGKVHKALPVKHMTYQEALEMSHFGAKVIYPATVIPAMEKKIPIHIKSTFDPDAIGTIVSDQSIAEEHLIKGISSIDNISLVLVQGSALVGAVAMHTYRLFRALASANINTILITQGSSEHSICFAVKPEDTDLTKSIIEEEFSLEIKAKYLDPVKVEKDLSVLAVIGENMKSRPGISARLFMALGKNGVNVAVTSQGPSERNISVAIKKKDEIKALNAVHEAFFLSDTYSINLFIVGVGLIGGTLLKQIREHATYLRKTQHVEINVVALANSKRMLFERQGIDLEDWKAQLNASEEKMDIRTFVSRMIGLNLRNSIFVDNTANPSLSDFYEQIIDNSISISTPNKVAPSGNFKSYKELKDLAYTRGVKFMYETNVGAGLPIITTITDLVNSGDRILKIEGVLSGSLSFIFNSFKEGLAFSEVVAQAKEAGYTEPDPREDLSGADVARKLTILARESGLALERENIELSPLLPSACMEAPTVEDFFNLLKAEDSRFEKLRKEAEDQGKVLRFIGTLDHEKAYISLNAVDTDSPFYHLSGSDNMVVFTTDRYKDRPLVIKGPGAGAEVTAAGVFAEIIRIAYYLS